MWPSCMPYPAYKLKAISYPLTLFILCQAWPRWLSANDIDNDFLPHLLYTACMVSEIDQSSAIPRGQNSLYINDLMCKVHRSVCFKEPESQVCKDASISFHVAEYAENDSFVLYTAASIGRMDLLTAMIAKGTDVNASLPGFAGWNPLAIASAENHDSAVTALLDAGADPNRKNDLGRTALMFASSYGYTDIVSQLLDHKANPDIVPPDETGWTALITAACAGHTDTVQLLLARGADPTIKDKRGKTALYCAPG